MGLRAFPVVYGSDVEVTAGFYERLGFARQFQFPAEGPAGYVALRRDDAEVAVVARDWPRDHYGIAPGDAPTFEMFVYVEDADAVVADLRAAGVRVVREPADMPWGERVAFVLDPDGNPVALATTPSP